MWLWGAYHYPYLATSLFVLTVLIAVVKALPRPREVVTQPIENVAWINPATGDVVDQAEPIWEDQVDNTDSVTVSFKDRPHA